MVTAALAAGSKVCASGKNRACAIAAFSLVIPSACGASHACALSAGGDEARMLRLRQRQVKPRSDYYRALRNCVTPLGPHPPLSPLPQGARGASSETGSSSGFVIINNAPVIMVMWRRAAHKRGAYGACKHLQSDVACAGEERRGCVMAFVPQCLLHRSFPGRPGSHYQTVM
jgi:hypothetical protein